MSEIQLKHVYKTFDDGVSVVKDFQLDIADQEFVILVGPSGCGKSTTLRMIAGLEKISDGELYIDGKKMNDVAACDRDIAMVFQNYALYPHMSVAENMAYSLRLKGVSKKERREIVEETAKILGLTEVLDRKPGELSGGQRQRVAMGRAIVRRPRAFLMDEPLSNLDAKLRTSMRVEILKLYRELKTTFIYVTHDQTEAMTLGTRVVVMKDGVIQQAASPEELYNRPANVFVAGFIGMPPMNFFRGKCRRRTNGRLCITVGELRLEPGRELEEELRKNGYEEKDVIVGVRPEDMLAEKADESEAAGGKSNPVTVDVCEMLGAEGYLYFDREGKTMAIRVPAGCTIRKGDRIRFGMKTDKLHLFDGDTQRRIGK